MARDPVFAPQIERPSSVPAVGVVPAFDAGWEAHETGLERDTVAVLTPPSGREWALLGYDTRSLIAQKNRDANSHSHADEPQQ